MINLEYKSIEIHWIALYENGDNATYFDSFEVEYIPEEIKKFTRNRNIATIYIYIYIYIYIGYKHIIQ